MRIHPLAVAAAGALLASALACRPSESRSGGATGGTLVVSTAADADYLLPVLNQTLQGKEVTDLMYERLAEIDSTLDWADDRTWSPRLADRWDWSRDSLSIAFHLDPRARWHDGQPVRSSDVRFSYRIYSDSATGAAAAPLVANIDSVSTPDSLTAVVWYKHRNPAQFFTFVYNVTIMPEHILRDVPPAQLATSEVTRHPVGTGPFRFVKWVPGSTIELVADTSYYRGRPKLDRVIFSISPDYNTAATRLLAGEADFLEILRAPIIPEVQKNPALRAVPYPSLDYGFLAFDLRDPKHPTQPHPLFGDRRVRRALTMALDRPAMVKNVFDTLAMVALGPFPRVIAPDTNLREIPFDTAHAKALLDSAGWHLDAASGIRAKNGRPLEFTVIVPNSSKIRGNFAVLAQQQLRSVGAKLDIEQLDFSAFMTRQLARKFDATLGAWHVDPYPGSIVQTWSSAGARAKDGSNYGSYESPTFDAYVDSALTTLRPADRKRYFHAAYQTIVDDAPAVWLYEPKNVAGAQRRLQIVGVRPDAWWAGLARWWIPANQRIARDNIGLRAGSE